MMQFQALFDPPFERDAEYVNLSNEDDVAGTLPGHPQIILENHENTTEFLLGEYCSPDMEAMSKHLWMMSMQSSRNVSPLHRQKLKGRELVITEDPKLHLVWFYDRIFLKPLPLYLCSYNFWTQQMGKDRCIHDQRRREARAGALGYLQTWSLLIQYESDFRIANSPELMLLPEGMSWNKFCKLSASLKWIDNSKVCGRYSFGEIRLTRLNFYAKFLLSKRSYQRMQGQYREYFAKFFGPLLFLIAVLSILLNSLQVVMAVEQVDSYDWTTFGATARWFAVLCCGITLMLSFGLAWLLVFKITSEWIYALKDRFWRGPPPRIDPEI